MKLDINLRVADLKVSFNQGEAKIKWRQNCRRQGQR